MDLHNGIEYEMHGDVLHVRIGGPDFVMEQAQDVVELVFEELDEEPPEDIILDLTGVNYINSSGISVVIRLNLERNLRLVNPSSMVTDILELTGILPFVPRFETVEEAIASF